RSRRSPRRFGFWRRPDSSAHALATAAKLFGSSGLDEAEESTMPFRPPRLQAELERIAQERLVAEREADRIYRREVFRVSLECIGCCCLGLLSMGFALHTTDRDIGAIAWW